MPSVINFPLISHGPCALPQFEQWAAAHEDHDISLIFY